MAVDVLPKELDVRIFAYVSQILGLRAYDIMHEATIAHEGLTVEEGAKLLEKSISGELIIVDDNKNIVGIVTDKDIARRVVARGLDPKTTKLKDIMSKDVIVVLGDADLSTVVRIMEQYNIRRVPVVTRLGKLLGVIDARSLAGALSAQRDFLKKIIVGLEAQLTQIAKEYEELKKKEEEAAKKKEIYG